MPISATPPAPPSAPPLPAIRTPCTARTLRARRGVAALAAILVLGAAGCSEAPDAAPPAEEASGASPLETSPLEVSAVRVRGWAGAPLNEDTGWAAPPGQAAVVFADRPFRIRFEVEAPPGSGGALPTHFSLQARRNEGRWETLGLRDFPYPDEISTPRVSLTRVEVWAGGLASEDLLDGSSFPFAPGQGVSDPVSYDVEGDALPSDSVTAPWPETTAAEDGAVSPTPPVHGEWEWPLVIRRWADGAVTNEAGDTFDFRMVDDRGRPLGGTGPVRVTLRIPEGLLGGTYVETPGVLGPWQDDEGTLYFPMEPAETFNVLMMMASDDHGASWEERDGANRPLTDDLEGFATARAGDTIYLLHQISEATFLHGFDTARERWVIRDEPVSTHGEPPTQVAALVDRSDGSLVALYGDSLGLLHRTRAPGGGWGPEGRVPVEGGGVASGIMATRAADDVVHLAYTVTAPDGGERRVEHRALSPDGTLTRATVLGGGIGTSDDEIGALLPLGWVEGPNTVVVAWRGADGLLRERRIRADGSVSGEIRISPRTVVQSGADSEQVGADLVVHDGAVHVVFIDARTGALWHAVSPAPGSWRAVGEVVGGIDAQWVRGRAVEGADGEPVYGIVYDAGSDGGSGKNRYHAIPLDRGG